MTYSYYNLGYHVCLGRFALGKQRAYFYRLKNSVLQTLKLNFARLI